MQLFIFVIWPAAANQAKADALLLICLLIWLVREKNEEVGAIM
jgi:hypothetical protein